MLCIHVHPGADPQIFEKEVEKIFLKRGRGEEKNWEQKCTLIYFIIKQVNISQKLKISKCNPSPIPPSQHIVNDQDIFINYVKNMYYNMLLSEMAIKQLSSLSSPPPSSLSLSRTRTAPPPPRRLAGSAPT